MDMFFKNNQKKGTINTIINKFVEQITMESGEDGVPTRKLTIESSERDDSVKDIDSKLTSLENLIKKLQNEIDEMAANVDKPFTAHLCSVSYSLSKQLIPEYELHIPDDSEPKHALEEPSTITKNDDNKLDELSAPDLNDSLTNKLGNCDKTIQDVKPCELENSAPENTSVLLITNHDSDVKINEQTKHYNEIVDGDKEIDRSGHEPKNADFNTEENNKVEDEPVTRTVLPQNLIYIDSGQIINIIDDTGENEFSNEIYQHCQDHEEVSGTVTEEKKESKQNKEAAVESTIFPNTEQFFFFESSYTMKALNLVSENRSIKNRYLKENFIPATKENEDEKLNNALEESILPVVHHYNDESKKILNDLIVNTCFNELDKNSIENDGEDSKDTFILVSEDLSPPLPSVKAIKGTQGENDSRDIVVTTNNNEMLDCKRYNSNTLLYDKDTVDEEITESKESISETIASLDCPEPTYEFQDAVE